MESYEDRINQALALWLVSYAEHAKNAFDSLVSLLESYAKSTEDSLDKREALTKNVWLKVFEQHCAGNSEGVREYDLLEGLFASKRYLVLFEKEETARAFVVATIRYVETNTFQPTYSFATINRESIRLKLVDAVYKWLGPDEDWATATLRSMAIALFGEPWCVLVYDSCGDSASLADTIANTQPAFLPGRLMSTLDPPAEDLPEMTC